LFSDSGIVPAADGDKAIARAVARPACASTAAACCAGADPEVFEAMKDLITGEIMECRLQIPALQRISVLDPPHRNTLLSNEKRGKDFVALVQKTGGTASSADTAAAIAEPPLRQRPPLRRRG
jgi:hypothetical protein